MINMVAPTLFFALKEESMKHIGIDFLKHVPYLTKENYKSVLPYKKEGANDLYFNDLQSCAALLKEKYNGEVNPDFAT